MVLKYSKTTRSSLMMLEAGVSHCKNKKRREGNYNFLYSTCSFKYFPCLRCFNVLYCIPSFSAVILQLFLSFFSLTTCISVGPSCYCISEIFVFVLTQSTTFVSYLAKGLHALFKYRPCHFTGKSVETFHAFALYGACVACYQCHDL